jgi:5'-nucleotidase
MNQAHRGSLQPEADLRHVVRTDSSPAQDATAQGGSWLTGTSLMTNSSAVATPLLPPVRWVFFDIGNVLFNDDAQAFYSYRYFHEQFLADDPGLTFDQLLAEREDEARRQPTWVLKRIAMRRLGEARYRQSAHQLAQELRERYDDHHLINPGVTETLSRLRSSFRLGIVANQTPECRDSLRRRGLLAWFDLVAISDELSLQKPDPAIFQWALEQAGCAADAAVMVGDRLDNDIQPAAELGLKTVLIDWGSTKGKCWQPDDEWAVRFLASIDRVPVFPSAISDVAPNATVSRLEELIPLLLP